MIYDYSENDNAEPREDDALAENEINLVSLLVPCRQAPERQANLRRDGAQVTDVSNGNQTTRWPDGRSITRSAPRNGEPGRILSAITSSGDQLYFNYSDATTHMPESVAFNQEAYKVYDKPVGRVIILNQQSGEVSIGGVDENGRGYNLSYQLSGRSELAYADGTRIVTTRTAATENSVTTDRDGREIARTERNRQSGAYATLESFHSVDGLNREVTTFARSWHEPEGRACLIPGLTRVQVNEIRQMHGMQPLAASAAPTWTERITTQRESYDPATGERVIRYLTTPLAREFRTTISADGHIRTASPYKNRNK